MQPSREQMLEDIDKLTADLIVSEAENKLLRADRAQAYDRGYEDALESIDEDAPYDNGYEAGYEDGFDDGMEEAGHKYVGEPK